MKKNLLGFFILLALCGCNELLSRDNSKKVIDREVILHSGPLYDRVSDFMENKLLMNGFNGSILVAKGDTIVYEKYSGSTDLRKKDSINEHTSFQIASTSKTLTAIAILQMVQEGKLSLEDSLQKFFPDFPYRGVSVRMLLSHRSGLPNYIYFITNKNWDKPGNVTNNDVLNFLTTQQPGITYTPGSRYNYSNTNFVILALIIEKISGKSFPQYMKEYFFDPLQMHDTYVYTPGDSLATMSFYGNNNLWQNDMFDETYGDKNVYSTPRDLLRWSNMLFSGRLINAAMMDSAFSPQFSDIHLTDGKKFPHHYYGLGFRLMITPAGKKVIYHFGRWHGFNAAFAKLQDENVTIIILGNKFNEMIYNTAWRSYNLFGDYFNEVANDEETVSEPPKKIRPANKNKGRSKIRTSRTKKLKR